MPSQAAAAEQRVRDGNDVPGSPALPPTQPDKDNDTAMDVQVEGSEKTAPATQFFPYVRYGSSSIMQEPEAMQVDAPQPWYCPKSDATPPGVTPPTTVELALVNQILAALGCERVGVLTAQAVRGRLSSNVLPEGELHTTLGLADPGLSGMLTKVELVMALRMMAWATIGSFSLGDTLDNLGRMLKTPFSTSSL